MVAKMPVSHHQVAVLTTLDQETQASEYLIQASTSVNQVISLPKAITNPAQTLLINHGELS